MTVSTERRELGRSGIKVSSVAMGCWPIAGMTSIDVNQEDSEQTLKAAVDSGINFFDTAYAYGMEGESERLIGQVLGDRRDEIVIASKGALLWDSNRQRIHDGRPASIIRHCEESLERLGFDVIDLFYLHAPDPEVSVQESASAFAQLMEQGKIRSVGVSNVDVRQLADFQTVCEVSVVQPHYNMLQREIEAELVPYCVEHSISLATYWPLMKGLLAGKLRRDHQFAPNDGRAKYPMFQGEEWERNQDFVDTLREIAEQAGKTVAQLVVNWTMNQPGITSALVGAKRAYQIIETAGAMGWELTPDQLEQINLAIEKRGTPVTRAAV